VCSSVLWCVTYQINVSKHNFSLYKPFIEAGKTVNIDLSGEAACCTSTTDCSIFANKTCVLASSCCCLCVDLRWRD
jgi:hypothetical protein